MRLYEKHRPRSLSEIVGQFPVRILRAVAKEPYASCYLLEGGPGCGKTCSALALAHDVGCEDPFSGLHFIIASELSVDVARELFDSQLRMRPLAGRGWQVLIIEELELLSPQCQTFLKVALETRMPQQLLVVATSNGAGKLSKALLQRFTLLRYDGGQVFAAACRDRLRKIWQTEFPGRPFPATGDNWGWDGDEFSMRSALDAMATFGLSQFSNREAA